MVSIKTHRTNTIMYCIHWQETVRFYRDMLGLPIKFKTDWFVEFQLTNDSYLSIADAARATINTAGGIGITLSWQVSHLERIRQSLKEKGVDVGPIQSMWDATVFYFKDPEGHRIEFWA